MKTPAPTYKRKIYRDLLRPYGLLTDNEKSNSQTFSRTLINVFSDAYFSYNLRLIEITDEKEWFEEVGSFSSHSSVYEKDQKRYLDFTIAINRDTFTGTDDFELTQRLLGIAHEILYFCQYPQIVENHGGEINYDLLRSLCVVPSPSEETDLVCSYRTTLRFIHHIKVLLGTTIDNDELLRKFQKSQRGQTQFRNFFREERKISNEIAYMKLLSLFEIEVLPSESEFGSLCKNIGRQFKRNKSEDFMIQKCIELQKYLTEKHGEDYSFDIEFIHFLIVHFY